MCFLELTVRKISDYYLELSEGLTSILPHFSWILLSQSKVNLQNRKI